MMLILAPFFLAILHTISAQSYVQPEQIHLAYGGDPSIMSVTWITMADTEESVVEWGNMNFNTRTVGNTTTFVDGGTENRKFYVHRVWLTGLVEKTTYIYHCGSKYGWSSIYYFTALPRGANWSPRFLVFGDMGSSNAQSLSRMQQEVQRGHFDMALHVGDMGYNMDTDNARVGDQFMRQIEPIAAYLPYMTCVGNHEQAYNFSNYIQRFTMPGGSDNLFYSFDVGPAHIIALSTEFYFFVEYGWQQIPNQFAWLTEDLKRANANRDRVPWIITIGHRPMYCSNWDTDDCTKYESIIRGGLPFIGAYGLEKLFFDNGVDLSFWAHEHSFERMWPLFNRTVYNGSKDPYDNPVAPVHIVTGSAGCQENTDPFVPYPPPWSAFRSSEYGYTRMTVFNTTHLYLEQVSDDRNGSVIDTMWLRKTHHPRSFHELKRPKGLHFGLDMQPPPRGAEKCKKCAQL